jgi:hypothetical protein
MLAFGGSELHPAVEHAIYRGDHAVVAGSIIRIVEIYVANRMSTL